MSPFFSTLLYVWVLFLFIATEKKNNQHPRTDLRDPRACKDKTCLQPPAWAGFVFQMKVGGSDWSTVPHLSFKQEKSNESRPLCNFPSLYSAFLLHYTLPDTCVFPVYDRAWTRSLQWGPSLHQGGLLCFPNYSSAK